MQQFDAIRPYRDDEVPGAVGRLLKDPQFLNLVGEYKLPCLASWAPAVVRFIAQRWLSREFGHVKSVDELQMKLEDLVEGLIANSTSLVSQSGLEALEQHKPYLFLSNHRDIVFDPLVVNYLLYKRGLETARIAIGDNLLDNRPFAEMMRLNKSFIVRRNMTSARDARDAYLTLSSFIWHCLEERYSVWIAQREGRAKTGVDRTDPAIIKMFYMSQKKAGLGFSEAMNRLNIVPVSISYEYDPCDAAKGRELEIRERTGEYCKGPDEDSRQIVQGITGYKGRVHVHFGKPITEAPDNAADLAAMIDREINGNYHLHASNLAAYSLLYGESKAVGAASPKASLLNESDQQTARDALLQRLEQSAPEYRSYMLAMYANPVVQTLAARSVSGTDL